MLPSVENITLDKIVLPFTAEVNLYILRTDKTHPDISGNKFFKLKYNLLEAKKQNKHTLLTFGGAYSNHIAATAAAGKVYGFQTIGVIRGDELQDSSSKKGRNPTLRFAEESGMKLHFVSRTDYRQKTDPDFILDLEKRFGDFYLIPEGGTNHLALKGSAEIRELISIPFDYICSAVGTGGTIAGIISSLKENQKAIGFSILKAEGYHYKEVEKLLSHFQIPALSNFQINENYHFGGYAKYNSELLQFISDFEKQTHVPFDQVYTGKMMFGLMDLIKKNYFQKGATIIAVHTGGLQGKLQAMAEAQD